MASKLRKALRTAAEDEGDGPPPPIIAHGHAYTLDADPGIVDYHRFRRLTQRARTAAEQGDDTQALAQLTQADALWTGEPLAGLRGDWADGARATLSGERLAATLTGIEVDLRMGHFTDLVPVLSQLVSAHPTDQTLVSRLMLALHGAGRQDDALARYRATRRTLDQHLGTTPGRELTELHARILAGTPAERLVPRARNPAAKAPEPVPAPSQLPPLVGREVDLADLVRAVTSSGHARAVAITGTGGVGKSLLARHLAERLRDRFPEGQFLVSLHGFSVARQPLTAESALLELLRAIGVPLTRLPVAFGQRVELWLRMLTEHRYVIVLDDVAQAEQVRQLIPVTSNSLLILTSRVNLSDLPTVHQHGVGLLSMTSAVELFQQLVGERAAHQDVVRDIIARTDCLPLAVEILAMRFRSRASWTLQHLAQRLSTATSLIDEFHYKENALTVHLDLSYRTLSTDHQRAFRLLGLHPGPRFDQFAAAALLGAPLRQSERALEALLDAHLIQEPNVETFSFHDLLGSFAADLAESESSMEERTAAANRLTRFALCATDHADRLLYPHRLRLPFADLPPGPPAGLSWNSPAQARRWLINEQAGLLAIQQRAIADGNRIDAFRLLHLLAGFLDAECFWADAVPLHQSAAEFWHTTDQPQAEVRALLDLGYAHQRGTQYLQADASTTRALRLARAAEDVEGVAEALNQRGMRHAREGDQMVALALLEEALAANQDTGNQRQHDRIVNNIGISLMHMGQQDRAITALDDALAGFNAAGNSRLSAQLLTNLGYAQSKSGDTATAHATFKRSLSTGTGVLSELEIAMIQNNLVATTRLPAELDQARMLQESTLTTFRSAGDRWNQAEGLITLGNLHQRAERPHEAATLHREALALATRIGADHKQVAALLGLGLAEAQLGHDESARRHLLAACDLAARIKAPVEGVQARTALAELLDHRNGTRKAEHRRAP
ncbi:BTAD domain-containing putative transcriptional regulator [Kitasatospora sp. NPDC008050]|uniref:AfsR/SARP family transcriptional regulator n=1 Tax=Kitasatospora sp. NPDC008050 TaxID=3364021 RepID=UPI0036EF4791